MNTPEWRYGSASVIGTSHLKQCDAVCQDSHTCGVITGIEGPLLYAIASDGAGSAPQSAIGSRLTCESLENSFSTFLSAGGLLHSVDLVMVREWLSELRKRICLEATSQNRPVRHFACTVLSALVGESAAVFFQIGDGSIVVGGGDSEDFDWVFWPDRGEYENTTVFVTDPTSEEHLQYESVNRQVDRVAVFTDGIQRLALNLQEQRPHARFFEPLFRELNQSPPGRADLFSENLRMFLASDRINSRTDDDKTLILGDCRASDQKC